VTVLYLGAFKEGMPRFGAVRHTAEAQASLFGLSLLDKETNATARDMAAKGDMGMPI